MIETAKEPFTDFHVNATGTLNLLESFRKYCPEASFLFTSTNKVYGDTPNFLPFDEKSFDMKLKNHKYFKHGIDESMSLDHTTHSLFGASKASADLLGSRVWRYFNLRTKYVLEGCLTGENHSGAQLHGFNLSKNNNVNDKKNISVFGKESK